MRWTSFLCFLLAIIAIADSAKRRKVKYCILDNFMLCLDETLARFTQQTNGTGVATSDQEYEEYCHALGDVGQNCMNKFLQRCASPIWKEIFGYFILNRQVANLNSFCAKGNDTVRERFLRNADCIIHKVKLTKEYRETCIRNLLQELEEVEDEASKPIRFLKLVTKLCCPVNRWLTCIQDMIEDKCNKEASDVFPNLLKSVDYFALDACTAMPEMHPNHPNTMCNKDFKPSVSDPRGIKTKLLGPYLFNVNCPNVAYGIDNDNHL